METKSTEEMASSAEKLLQDLKAVIRDGEDLLRAGARDLSERGVAAKERLAAALEVAKDTQRRLQGNVVSTARSTDKLVRGHPYESVGIAFGIGVLVGIIANRR